MEHSTVSYAPGYTEVISPVPASVDQIWKSLKRVSNIGYKNAVLEQCDSNRYF